MNAAWQIGYSDRMHNKQPQHQDGPTAIVGITAKDYCSGYAAASRDIIWANNNRPPMV